MVANFCLFAYAIIWVITIARLGDFNSHNLAMLLLSSTLEVITFGMQSCAHWLFALEYLQIAKSMPLAL